MIPRLDISFPIKNQWHYWYGKQYEPQNGEYLVNHARTGIIMALRATLPNGGRVGVVAYNCHTVANAVVNAGCTPVFVDVTEGLQIDIQSVPANLEAIIVTNLFGIRNDVETIRKRCPKAIVIVDNAHGYGLPVEGDFTVYSINQGKFPALGEGGILYAIDDFRFKIDDLYKALPSYGLVAQFKLFVAMLLKAIAYSRCMYWFIRRLKKSSKYNVRQEVEMRQMAPRIRRIYRDVLPEIFKQIEQQRTNASKIRDLGFERSDLLVGENAFMVVVRTRDVAGLKDYFAKRGVETETHFAHATEWAQQFGYVPGTCPTAERLTKELLMIPTYRRV